MDNSDVSSINPFTYEDNFSAKPLILIKFNKNPQINPSGTSAVKLYLEL